MTRRRPFARRGLVPALAASLLAVVGCSASDAQQATGDTTGEEPRTTLRTADPPVDGTAEVAEPAPSQVSARAPNAVRLPSGAVLPVDRSATAADGTLAIPDDVERAGWWDGGARLGDPFGGIVVAAHVDSFEQGIGPFAELLSARPGDVVELRAEGLRQRFEVVSVALVPKSAIRPDSDVFSVVGSPRLVLITCGGAYDAAAGGYQDNLVVIAEPSGPIEER